MNLRAQHLYEPETSRKYKNKTPKKMNLRSQQFRLKKTTSFMNAAQTISAPLHGKVLVPVVSVYPPLFLRNISTPSTVAYRARPIPPNPNLRSVGMNYPIPQGGKKARYLTLVYRI